MPVSSLGINIALMNGQHMVHLNGPYAQVENLVLASKGVLKMGEKLTRPTMAFGPESRTGELRAHWAAANTNAAKLALSLLKDAAKSHARLHPNCAVASPTLAR